MSQAGDIKIKIEDMLKELVRNQTLGQLIVHDPKRNDIFSYDFAKYPVAILPDPVIEGSPEDSRNNRRTYVYEIVLVHSPAEIGTSKTAMIDLIETVLDKFDNKPSLDGLANADGAVEPSTSPIEPVTARGETYLTASILLRINASKTLTF